MSNLPLKNLGFKTSEPKRKPHFSPDVENWYTDLLSQEKISGSLTDKQITDNFLRHFYSDPSYRAKIVARHEGCICIEVFRWLEITKQAQSNYLWVISQSGTDYIKIG